MKISNLYKSSFTLTGSSVLKLIMSQGIPEIDLLVRESIQNSLDAVKSDCKYVKIEYFINKFISKDLSFHLGEIGEKIDSIFGEKEYDYIAIKDSNTKGLLGTHLLSKGENNLYNLVYDVMNSNKGNNAGGSWGIGKSVYYRFGNGICFYYSRTFEEGRYLSKLAGAVIEDERKDDRLTTNNTGVSFIGDIDSNDKPMPIYDESKILAFLKIFNIQAFSGSETGTIVIIPYFNCKKMLDGQRNHDFSWNKKIDDAVEMSIQRWYFSRLNNEKYSYGAYLVSRVNNKRVELNHFFKMMQSMYNEEDSLSTKVTIKHDYFFEELGHFYYRTFTKKELMNPFGPFIPPYAYFDVEYEEGVNKGIIFYMRKPGMALSYDSKEFNTITTKKDEYFIGMFRLNDSCHFGDEYLGEYFRNTEQASHTSWSNDPYKEFPVFNSKKPYTKIKNIINKEVEKLFNVDSQVIDEASVSVLQKKLGRLLLPPEDFGKGVSVDPVVPKTPKVKKKTKQTIKFAGFKDDLMVFNVNLKMNCDDTVRFYASVSANGKYSFNEWHKMGFDVPVEFILFRICNIVVGKEKIDTNHQISFENMVPQILCAKGERLIKYSPAKDSGGNIFGISLNNCSKNEVDFTFDLLLKPLDLTYSIIIDTEWVTKAKAVGDANE